jgi:hypothetical protein
MAALLTLEKAVEGNIPQVSLEVRRQPVDAGARQLVVPSQERPDRACLVVTACTPEGASPEECQLVARRGQKRSTLGPKAAASIASELSALAERQLAGLTGEQRLQILDFLAAASEAHALTAPDSVGEGHRALRDALRPRLPKSVVKPDAHFGVFLDQVLALDDKRFLMNGWLRHPSPARAELTFLSPEGASVRVQPAALSRRRDVDEAYGDAEGGRGPANRGFCAVAELGAPSRSSRGWTVQLHGDEGKGVERGYEKDVIRDRGKVKPTVMRHFPTAGQEGLVSPGDLFGVLREHQETVTALEPGEVRDFGDVPPAPDVTVVVPLSGRIDVVEHQVAQFAHDQEMLDVELLYVAVPKVFDELCEKVARLHALYGQPVRVLRLSEEGPRSAMTNVGAALAAGRLVVMLGGDVFPAQAGWLSPMVERHDRTSSVGAVGPKLLHEDDSIAHAGLSASGESAGSEWKPVALYKGLHRQLPAAGVARRVAAVSGSCLLISADLLRSGGGLSCQYLLDENEGLDLCLRLDRAGLENWVEPDAELYRLDGLFSRSTPPHAMPYDDWLLERSWGAPGADGAYNGRMVSPAATRLPSFATLDLDSADSPVEILEVNTVPAGKPLLDARLVWPRAHDEVKAHAKTYAFALQGWALGAKGESFHVEVLHEDVGMHQTPVSIMREDVKEQYPDVPGSDRAGFSTVVSTISLPQDFELRVDAVSDNSGRATVGTIKGRRRPLGSGYKPALNSLLVTSLGRAGSSWMTLVLSCHPEVVGYRPFEYEARVGSYWLEVLRTLAEPASYVQTIRPELYQGHWFIGDKRPSPTPVQVSDSRMLQWLGRASVEDLVAFCQNRIETFYQEVARTEGKTGARYFTEKGWPDRFAPRMLGELYPDGREVILVRDFRDMVCSVLGFNEKLGFASFGREHANSDEEFVTERRSDTVRLLESWRERQDTAHLVRYEDLILEPEVTLRSLFSYLDVDASEDTVRAVLDRASSSFTEGQEEHRTASSVEGSVGRWRKDLPPELIEACNQSFGDVLAEFGYEVEPATAGKPRPARREAG